MIDNKQDVNCPHCGKTIIVKFKSTIRVKIIDVEKSEVNLP